MFFNKKDNDSKQRFGIRKLTVGACSVLLSTLILGVEMQEQTSKVQAATADTFSNYSTTEPTENSKNTYLTSSEVKETTNENTSENKQEDVDSVNTAKNTSESEEKENENATNLVSVTENNKLKTVSDKNESVSEETTIKAKTVKNNDKNSATFTKQNIAENKVVDNASKAESQKETSNREIATKELTNGSSTTINTANLDLSEIKTNGSTNQLEGTVESSLQKTTNVSKFRVLAVSTNIAEADQIKDNAAVTIPSSDSRYTLYISRNTWGNTENGSQQVKILLSGSILPGDTVSISIPSYNIIGVSQPNIDSNYGTSSIKDDGNNKVVTYSFTTSGVINPIIIINPDNGYGGKPTPMQITQPTVKDITWSINGVQQKSAEFHIDINPAWNPKFALTKPNPNSTDSNALKKMIPDYESIYQLAINETNGVAPAQDYTNNLPYYSNQINSAVNYGTVITIPMPKGYVLDHAATMQLNNFGDQTTITQAGNNIIITVPKGSGTQGWNSGPAYQLVGSYNIAMPETATTYTADAPITIVQKLNDDGSQTKTWTGPTVK